MSAALCAAPGRADRKAELLASLEVVDGQLMQAVHGAHRLGGQCGNGLIDCTSSTCRPLSGPATTASEPTPRPKASHRRRAGVLRGIAASGDAVGLGSTRNRPMPLRSAREPETRAVTISLSALSPARTRPSRFQRVPTLAVARAWSRHQPDRSALGVPGAPEPASNLPSTTAAPAP